MSFLLDTNVLSEVRRPEPDVSVISWLDAVDEDRVFVSVASIAEIRRGTALMGEGRRRETLAVWLRDELSRRFESRILPIDHVVAERWGDLMAKARRAGLNLNPMDAFFGATTLAHGLTLVTRNVKHFAGLDVPLLNPWEPIVAPIT